MQRTYIDYTELIDKHKIPLFGIVVLQETAKKCTKTSFRSIKPIVLWRYHYRCRRE